jgi:ribonuclease HII
MSFQPLAKVYEIGVDEAGRGPLAGPVTAAAVVFRPGMPVLSVADSKTLSLANRKRLEEVIKKDALAWGIGWATTEEIDRLNILQASLLAMRRAIAKCGIMRGIVLVDGIHCPKSGHDEWAIIKGDAKVSTISAASILAKQARDVEMCRLDNLYPGYGFAQHMGYPTKAHREALNRLGASLVHRKTFGPVRNVLAGLPA